MKRTPVAAVILAAGALAGCGGGSTGSAGAPAPEPTGTAVATTAADGVQQLTIHGTDALMFAPSSLRARVGMLAITFVNDGSVAHTLRIMGVEPHVSNLNGHSRTSVTVRLTRPGTYYVECDYHPSMVGTLVVTG